MGHLPLLHPITISEVTRRLLTLPSVRTESGPKDSTAIFLNYLYMWPLRPTGTPWAARCVGALSTPIVTKKNWNICFFLVFIKSIRCCRWQTYIPLFRCNVVKTVSEFCGRIRNRVSFSKIQLISFLAMVILLCYFLLSLSVEISSQHIPCTPQVTLRRVLVFAVLKERNWIIVPE
jgi:hypothetical protein